MKLLLCLTAIIAVTVSTPTGMRSTNRAVMFAGFVGRPPMEQPGFMFTPQLCKKCLDHDLPPSEETPQVEVAQETQTEIVQVAQKPQFEESATQTVETSGGAAETESDESDEEDDDFFPIFGKNAGGGAYNFFPVVFGGTRGRSGGVGGSTAIANSFSTGKKGVATSRATSYGSSARNDGVPARTKRSPQETLPDQFSLPLPEESLPESNDATQVAEPTADAVKPKEPEDDKDNFPLLWRSAGKNSIFNFFPVHFGGFRGRSGIPAGGSTAIANSFATGRKGVANSHATAYGPGFEPENTQIHTRRSPQADIEPNLISTDPEADVTPTEVTEETITEVSEQEVPVTEATTEKSIPNPRTVPRKTNPQWNFFPITFAGVRGRSSADSPGGATAIANSFSSGRGGISISHATSHGQ